MRNNFFDLRRFADYFVTDFKNCCSKYGLSLLVLCLGEVMVLLVCLLINQIAKQPITGISQGFTRLLVWGFFFMVSCIMGPKKCYGYITEKKEGTTFLMLPVSVFEKYLSMIIMCCVVIPLAFVAGYFLVDYILCLTVTSFQNVALYKLALFGFGENLPQFLINADAGETKVMLGNITVRAFLWDEPAQYSLIFLIGALFFKKNKTAKTVLIFVIFSCLMSTITMTIFGDKFQTAISALNEMEDLESVKNAIHKVKLIENGGDALKMSIYLLVIWFRVKTIKH